MKVQSTHKVVIDRIEGNKAVIVLYEDDGVKFNLPTSFLPEGVKEGEHLQMSFSVDKESREAQKKRITDLLNDLKGNKESR
jgi:Protein of unknown function (DUF3006)